VKPLTDNSPVARLLAGLARAICRRPRLFFFPHVVLLVLSIACTIGNLEFDTSRNSLVGANKKYHQNLLRYKEEFPPQDDLVVVVESEDREKNRQFVERLSAKLGAETNLFVNVTYKGNLKMLGSKALLFVPESELTVLKETLADYRPFIQQFTRTTNLVSLFDTVNTRFRKARREQGDEAESLVNALPAIERIVSQAEACLHRPGTPPSPGVDALFGAGAEAEEEMYITFGGGRIYLVTAHAPREDLNAAAILRLRQLVAQTRIEVPGLNVGITGEPVMEYDEMAQAQKDTAAASIASLFLCALIFIYGYRETGRPVKATICLVVGLSYTLAFATLAVGHLNILTITFAPILIGLAIDFGVHLITRYEEELRHGKSEEAALTRAMVFTGQGIFSGALTTGGAFLAMGLTDFKGIREMGLICGGGLLICLVPMMTLLPVLLLRGRQNIIDHSQGDLSEARARIENIWLKRPVTVAALTLALCAAAVSQWHKVFFDYDLRNMQSAGLPAVEFEKKLIHAGAAPGATNAAGKSLLFAAVVADSLEEAVRLEAQLTNLTLVAPNEGVISMARYLAADQTRSLRLIGEIKQELSGLRFDEPDRRPVDLSELSRSLYSTFGYLGAALEEVGTNEPALSEQLGSLRGAIENLRREMLRGNASELEVHARKLAVFQQALFNDMRETFLALQSQDNSAPLEIRDLPDSLRTRFVSATGKYLLQVYPTKDVWKRQNQKEFIGQLRRELDPNGTNHPIITGTPVQLYEYTELLKDSYVEAAWYALGAIALLILVHFRNLSSVLLALLPVAIGSVWLGGLMGFFGIPFNPANIMTLPLVIGIGVTNGIHILNRFAEEQTPGILARSTGKAVFVSGLTTIAGFGSLMLAKHRGIESLGQVMAIGVTMCMIAALTSLPALLNLLMRFRQPTKQPSADNARSTLGREEPR
jgi:hopanoid biosynthesis associated RND transporter like protein HpnN